MPYIEEHDLDEFYEKVIEKAKLIQNVLPFNGQDMAVDDQSVRQEVQEVVDLQPSALQDAEDVEVIPPSPPLAVNIMITKCHRAVTSSSLESDSALEMMTRPRFKRKCKAQSKKKTKKVEIFSTSDVDADEDTSSDECKPANSANAQR